MEGDYVRTIGADYFDRPTVFANDGENLLVGALNARVTIVGPNDELDRIPRRQYPGFRVTRVAK